MCVYGAEGAMGSSLGQAKRSPRLQAAAEIGPEGTEAAAAFLPSLQDGDAGDTSTLGLRFAYPRLLAIAPLARVWPTIR